MEQAYQQAKGDMTMAVADLELQAESARKLQEMKTKMESRRAGTLQNSGGSIPVGDAATDGGKAGGSARRAPRRRGSVTGLDDDALMAEFARDAVRQEQEAAQNTVDDAKHTEDDAWDKVHSPGGGMAGAAAGSSSGSASDDSEEDDIPGTRPRSRHLSCNPLCVQFSLARLPVHVADTFRTRGMQLSGLLLCDIVSALPMWYERGPACSALVG